MFSDDSDSHQGTVTALLVTLIATVVAATIGIGIATSTQPASKPATAFAALQVVPSVRPEPAAAISLPDAQAALAQSDSASVIVENQVVKFYFESGRADLPPGSLEALADLIQGAREGGKLRISGFHDGQGDKVRNAELALRRARAVQSALKQSGIGDAQLELSRPEQMEASASDAEARRVEVSLQLQ